jgi:hypothetical protein
MDLRAMSTRWIRATLLDDGSCPLEESAEGAVAAGSDQAGSGGKSPVASRLQRDEGQA